MKPTRSPRPSTENQRAVRQLQREGLEQEARQVIRIAELPAPDVHYPLRKIAGLTAGRQEHVDFAWPAQRLAVEINGGTWQAKSGHNSGRGLRRDWHKTNRLQLAGWLILTFTSDMVRDGTMYTTLKQWGTRCLQSLT